MNEVQTRSLYFLIFALFYPVAVTEFKFKTQGFLSLTCKVLYIISRLSRVGGGGGRGILNCHNKKYF